MLHPSTQPHIYDAACADRFVHHDWYSSGFVIHTWCISLNFNEIAHFEKKKMKTIKSFAISDQVEKQNEHEHNTLNDFDLVPRTFCQANYAWRR